MKIRAAVLEEFGSMLEVQDLDLAPPQAGEVLVKIEACGICHTDMYTASGADPSGYAPCVLGHEGAGVVEELGEGVTSLRKGDHVVTLFSPECGECIHCKSGRTNLCLAIREQQNQGYLPDGTTRLSRDGEPIRHFMGCSAFAQAVVMPEIALAKVPKEAELDKVCLLACGATTGVAAALWKAEVEEGSTCVVFGGGLVGLGAVAGCKIRGAERIVVVEPAEDRRRLAEQYGATETFAPDDHTVERILESTGGFGADYTFEATGNTRVMGQAVEVARMGWGLCTILGVAGKGEMLEILPRNLITGRRVQGGSFGGAKGRTHVPQLAQMYVDGKLDLESLVSHHIYLEYVNMGFDLMEAQDGVRAVIQF